MSAPRRVPATFGLALIIAGSLPLFAQEPKADDAKPAAEKPVAATRKSDPSRRVPNHFGQVGLTPEQRESIYKIRKAHYEKLEALRAEMAEIESKSMSECEAVLTETQRKLLENLRANGSGRSASKAVETAKAAK
jgi:Spy/CpxP family protein refolding chaperone